MGNLSPLKHRFKVLRAKVIARIAPQKNLFRESFDCYNQKLPKNVNVNWKREDDGYIVGNVNADGYEFMTQGKNAKDFIEMVNDAIYATYEIPPQYILLLGGYKRYFPKPHQLEELQDESITNASFRFNFNAEFAGAGV